jgi:hypothetical protein
MNPPVIDKVARRRSTAALLISLLALWISIQGITGVVANLIGLALGLIATAPLILVCIGAIVLLIKLPRILQHLKNSKVK